MSSRILRFLFFFFNDTATTEIYTLSLHDALPISSDGVEAELARLRDRDRHHAILERPRRVADRVVLHPDLAAAELVGQVLRADQRREAHVVADGDVAVDRQQRLVPPHARRAGLDRLPRDDALQRIVPIVDLEGTETELADMEGRRLV